MQKIRYKILDNIYFSLFDDVVYLRNVNQKKDFLFNEIVYDILNELKEEISFESLCTNLKKNYCISDDLEVDFESDIQHFLNELIENDIAKETTEIKQENFDIQEKIQTKCSEKHLLFSACLELTYRCNEKCVHCYVDDAPVDDNKELTFQDYKNILEQLREMGCSQVLITGGEPTLKDCFLDVCKYAKKLGLILNIYTNGLHITDELFDELLAIKPNSVSVSLYAADAKTHDSITQVKGSFDKTLKFVMSLKCAGIDTFIKSVVLKKNFEQYEKLFELGKRLNIIIGSALVIMDTHTSKEKNTMALDTEKDYKSFYRMLSKYHRNEIVDFAKTKRDKNSRLCGAGLYSISINPFGDINPCNALPIILGNVKNTTIKKAWNNFSVLNKITGLKFKDLSPECENCTYASACCVCLGASFYENKGKFAPCENTCKIAKAKFEEAKRIFT